MFQGWGGVGWGTLWRGGVGWGVSWRGGVGHAGVGWVMKRLGGSWRGGVGCAKFHELHETATGLHIYQKEPTIPPAFHKVWHSSSPLTSHDKWQIKLFSEFFIQLTWFFIQLTTIYEWLCSSWNPGMFFPKMFQGWGVVGWVGVCYEGVGWGGVHHKGVWWGGVGCVMKGWDGSWRGGVGCAKFHELHETATGLHIYQKELTIPPAFHKVWHSSSPLTSHDKWRIKLFSELFYTIDIQPFMSDSN